MTKESEIEAYLVRRVQEAGGEIRKVKWIARSNAPDRRVMMLWDVAPCFWVELKAPGEKPTDAQLREHKRMRDLGEVVYVIDSFEQIDQLMEQGYV